MREILSTKNVSDILESREKSIPLRIDKKDSIRDKICHMSNAIMHS